MLLHRIINRTYCRWCPDKVKCLAERQCQHQKFWLRILMFSTAIVPAITVLTLAVFKYTLSAFIFWGITVVAVLVDIFYVLPKIRP